MNVGETNQNQEQNTPELSNHNKWLWPLVVVLILGAIGVSVWAVYSRNKNQVREDKEYDTYIVNQVQWGEEDDSLGWETLSNEELGFEINYPPDDSYKVSQDSISSYNDNLYLSFDGFTDESVESQNSANEQYEWGAPALPFPYLLSELKEQLKLPLGDNCTLSHSYIEGFIKLCEVISLDGEKALHLITENLSKPFPSGTSEEYIVSFPENRWFEIIIYYGNTFSKSFPLLDEQKADEQQKKIINDAKAIISTFKFLE